MSLEVRGSNPPTGVAPHGSAGAGHGVHGVDRTAICPGRLWHAAAARFQDRGEREMALRHRGAAEITPGDAVTNMRHRRGADGRQRVDLHGRAAQGLRSVRSQR